MKNIFFIVLSFILFSSCTGDDDSINKLKPEDAPLINKIADLYFIDIWLSRLREQDRDSMRIELNRQFVELHGIEAKEMKVTLKELENDSKRYGLIMDSVIVILKNTQPANKEQSKK